MPIPADLREKIDNLMAGTGLNAVRDAADAVSTRYRREGSFAKDGANLQIRDGAEALAYVGTRLPATYGAAEHVLGRLPDDFAPRTMLDVGAGPGTVALAALDHFDSLRQVTLIEPNAHLRGIGASLVPNGTWINGDLATVDLPGKDFDLITAGYVLNELNARARAAVVDKLWAACSGMLVIIEPGTPEGSAVVQDVRDQLLEKGGSIAAPCPQMGACPLHDAVKRWCHFSQRVERSKLHRSLKGGALGYEDEKFSYIAFSRTPVALPQGRVLGHVTGSKVMQVEMCDDNGDFGTAQIAKSDPRYKDIKHLDWGDAVDFSL